MTIREEFKDYLNESEYQKAIKWFTKTAKELKILRNEPKPFQVKGAKYFNFELTPEVNLQKLKDELVKRFPELTIITQTGDNSIEVYE